MLFQIFSLLICYSYAKKNIIRSNSSMPIVCSITGESTTTNVPIYYYPDS